ncbi:hypothetical protein HPB48_015026 [Haemaphysalis longicornis]|uniref:Uncharacterized protein n=1 Tax=Haemaphysalis longicornis TaxID=44386 RepID=A0A9J6FSS9_HAELO|nr:hypothetical protein HPB48_015026 [Haemaphysalis longicornis]
MLAVLLGMWPVDAAGGQIPVYAAALYGGFARSIWAACVAWIVIACVGGHGGFVTTLLSLKSLVPPSRLTFAAYLVHMIPINVFYASRQHSFDLSAGLVVAKASGRAFTSLIRFEIAHACPQRSDSATENVGHDQLNVRYRIPRRGRHAVAALVAAARFSSGACRFCQPRGRSLGAAHIACTQHPP